LANDSVNHSPSGSDSLTATPPTQSARRSLPPLLPSPLLPSPGSGPFSLIRNLPFFGGTSSQQRALPNPFQLFRSVLPLPARSPQPSAIASSSSSLDEVKLLPPNPTTASDFTSAALESTGFSETQVYPPVQALQIAATIEEQIRRIRQRLTIAQSGCNEIDYSCQLNEICSGCNGGEGICAICEGLLNCVSTECQIQQVCSMCNQFESLSMPSPTVCTALLC